MDASKFLALVIGIAFAGLIRELWSSFVEREEAKPVELVEVDGRMIPKRTRLSVLRAIFHGITVAWMIAVGTMLAILIIHGPFDQ